MKKSRKPSTAQIDRVIADLRGEGKSQEYIKRLLHVGGQRIRDVEKGKESPGRTGRPSKLSDEIRTFVETQFLMDARISDSAMAAIYTWKSVEANRREPRGSSQRE